MNLAEFEAADRLMKQARCLQEQIQTYKQRLEALNGPRPNDQASYWYFQFAPSTEGGIYVNGPQMHEPIRTKLQALMQEHIVAAGSAFIHDALVVLEAEFAAIEISTPSAADIAVSVPAK